MNLSSNLSIAEMQEIQGGKTTQQFIACTMMGLSAQLATVAMGPLCIAVGALAGVGCWLS